MGFYKPTDNKSVRILPMLTQLKPHVFKIKPCERNVGDHVKIDSELHMMYDIDESYIIERISFLSPNSYLASLNKELVVNETYILTKFNEINSSCLVLDKNYYRLEKIKKILDDTRG